MRVILVALSLYSLIDFHLILGRKPKRTHEVINDFFIYNLNPFKFIHLNLKPTLSMVRSNGKAITLIKWMHCVLETGFLSVNLLEQQRHELAIHL